jgi:hypothetical protein
MRNEPFHKLLKEFRDERGKRRWTISRIAERIGSNPAHVTDVLNNTPGHGYRTRPRLVAFFKEHFHNWKEVLEALGWTEEGLIVPRGTTYHMEENNSVSGALDNPKGSG